MSEPKFTGFKNFQNNSVNSENSGQICTKVVRNLAKLCVLRGLVEVNKRTGKQNGLLPREMRRWT
jgi:hypothetical protein